MVIIWIFGYIISKKFTLLQQTKNLTENSCSSLELDEAFSEIEEELENKLWELYDKVQNQKNTKFTLQ